MGKWKANYDGGRKYNKEWEKTYTWCTKDSSSDNAFCKVCKCTVQPRLSTLKSHENSNKHVNNMPQQKTIEEHVVSTPREKKTDVIKVKEAEIQLAVAMACHCSIMTIDHLGEVPNSTLKSLRTYMSDNACQ